MNLKITDGNYANDAGVFTEIPLEKDSEGVKIRTRPLGEFLIIDTDSGDQWGVTPQAVAELERVTGRKLEIAAGQKTLMASIVEPVEPEAVEQPKKFTRERPGPRPSHSNDAIEAHDAIVAEYEDAKHTHAVASAGYSQFKDRTSRFEEDAKTWTDKKASTAATHADRQKDVELEVAKIALIKTMIEPGSHEKAFLGEALEESDLI